MQKPRALLFFVAGLVWISIPLLAVAQGIVPCGGSADPLGCDLCSLGQLMQNIINFLLLLTIPLAAALFAYAGFLYIRHGTNPTKIETAHKIFRNVLVGFLIAISAWLVVQTIMSTVFDGKFFVGGNWNELQCSKEKRLMNTNVSDLFGDLGVTQSVPTACPTGYQYEEVMSGCYNPQSGDIVSPVSRPVTAVTSAIGSGSCAPNMAFGANATAMSCICGQESAGQPNADSRTDIMKTNNLPFSFGLYQVNITANAIRCPNQPVLNCPDAFIGKNYDAQIKSGQKVLYEKCVAAAKNVQCNTNTAQYLYNNGGVNHWKNSAKVCGLR